MTDADSLCSHPTLLLDQARGFPLETEPRWNWSDFPDGFWDWIPNARRDAAARNENAIAVDCWKYGNEIHNPGKAQIRYVDDDNLKAWAQQPIPTQDGELPQAGLRLLHICIERCPFPKESLVVISEAFGIPRVDLSDTCRESGVCATIFTEDRNHPGMCLKVID
jgi:hypothetical protein